MSGFSGFRCWDITRLNETVKKDAVVPSTAVFLATHHPTIIQQKPLRGGGAAVETTEADLLASFSAPDNPELMLFPIIGDSGTGKSHLVRWLHAQLEHHPGWKVVYVPKYGTNLRSIVELVLEGMEGDEFDAARRALSKARDESIDEELAPERLLNELALQVGHAPPEGENPDHRRYLIEHLPVLLQDPVFRAKLLEEGGVLRRLVALALRGRQVDDRLDDDAGQFSADDLPLQVANVQTASQAAQGAFRYLIGEPTLQQTAVDLLNERLESAEASLFVSADLRVRDVMLEVRRALLDHDLELVLFIEDLTVLHGVQQELLDALVEPAQRGGEQVLCKLRAAIAVTSGYFEKLDTVRTRCEHAYDLNLPYGDDEAMSVDAAVDFVARYLNAARLGETELDRAYQAAKAQGIAADVQAWVPNHCESCEHRERCHDGFGITSEVGYGLYPFNRPALDRMVRAWSGEYFDPRRVLTEVVHHTLRLGELELPDARFPSEDLIRNFNDRHDQQLTADVAADLDERDPGDGKRRARVLTFWGGVPAEVVNLHPAVHDAFELLPLGDAPIRGPGGVGEGPPPPPPPPAEGIPSQLRAAFSELDRWHTGETLSQSTARDIRSLIHQSVVDRLSESSSELRVSTNQFGTNGGHFRQSSIALERAAGAGAALGSAMTLPVKADPATARLLKAALHASHLGGWDFDGGPVRLREWAAAVDDWAREVADTYLNSDRQTHEVDEALAALLVGARVRGLVGKDTNPPSLLAAVLDLQPAGSADRTRDWVRLEEAATSEDRAALRESLLERLGAAKGLSGSSRAIDAAAALPVLEATAADWEVEGLSPDSLADRFFGKVTRRLDKACAEETAQLQRWYDEVIEHLDPSVPPSQVTPAFLEAVDVAAKAGLLVSDASGRNPLDEAQRVAGQFAESSLEPIREIAQILERADGARPIDRVVDVAPDRAQSVAPLLEFCRVADRILSAAQDAVDHLGSSAGPGSGMASVAGLDQQLSAWLDTVQKAEETTC